MTAFLINQLDFILFFYGLAFVLLGAVAVAVARGAQQEIPWSILGAFAYLHGAGEWLSLLSLILGDQPAFALFRTVVGTASYIALAEFGRIDAKRSGLPMPGRWIYLPVLAVIVLGWYLAGTSGASAFARYFVAFPSATLVCAMLAMHARKSPPLERRWLIAASVAFGLFGIAVGFVVPSAPNWDGGAISYAMFLQAVGIPIALFRGVLACVIAFTIWAYLGQRLIVNTDSVRYAKFQRRQFVWTFSTMLTILVVGWFLTEVLGGIYKSHVQEQAIGDLDLIVSRLAGETAPTEGMVKALAGSRSVSELAAGNPKADRNRIDDILALETQASGAAEGFILDRRGVVLAAAVRASADRSVKLGEDISGAPYFRTAIAGHPGFHFSLNAANVAPDHFVSSPIRDESGAVIGVAVLKKPLARFEADLNRFDRSFALVDANGIIILTNRPAMRLRMMWPLPPETRAVLAKSYGALEDVPLMKKEFIGAHWSFVDGNRDYIQRRGLNHGDWSLITWKIPQGIFASRVVGIFATLLMTIMALIYLVGRSRWMHDNVQLEKRFELEELARSLDKRAATDPLTGLFNRRKFDRSLATEIMRAERYKTQLSLMLFDIDHFKRVNDEFGHPVGDTVLVEVARYATGRIRNSDVLARWGGEEFVILSPGNNGPMECMFAGNLLVGIGSLKIGDVGTVTCSFGVAEYQEGDTAETLLARADEALYRAKSNGRNRVELAAQPDIASPQIVPSQDAGGQLTPIGNS